MKSKILCAFFLVILAQAHVAHAAPQPIGLLDGLLGGLLDGVGNILNSVSGLVTTLLNGLQKTLSNAIQGLTNVVNGLAGAVTGVVNSATDSIINSNPTIDGSLIGARNSLSDVVEEFIDFSTIVTNTVSNAINSLPNGATLVPGGIGQMSDTLKNAADKISATDVSGQLLVALNKVVSVAVENVVNNFSKLKSVPQSVTDEINVLGTAAPTLFKMIVDKIGDIICLGLTPLSALSITVLEQVENMLNTSDISNVTSNALAANPSRNLTTISTPLKLLDIVPITILAIGLDNAVGTINYVTTILQNQSEEITGIVSDMTQAFVSMFPNVPCAGNHDTELAAFIKHTEVNVLTCLNNTISKLQNIATQFDNEAINFASNTAYANAGALDRTIKLAANSGSTFTNLCTVVKTCLMNAVGGIINDAAQIIISLTSCLSTGDL